MAHGEPAKNSRWWFFFSICYHLCSEYIYNWIINADVLVTSYVSWLWEELSFLQPLCSNTNTCDTNTHTHTYIYTHTRTCWSPGRELMRFCQVPTPTTNSLSPQFFQLILSPHSFPIMHFSLPSVCSLHETDRRTRRVGYMERQGEGLCRCGVVLCSSVSLCACLRACVRVSVCVSVCVGGAWEGRMWFCSKILKCLV